MKEQIPPNIEGVLPEWKEELKSVFADIEYKLGPEAVKERHDFVEHDKKLLERTKDAEVLYRFLRRFTGLDINIQEIEEGIFEVPCEIELEEPVELPQDYGYKGGMARSYLETSLGLSAMPVRDIDIVYLGTAEDKAVSNDLAKRYMPNDYQNGYGVEQLEEDYFTTRDFTLNEVYVSDANKIRATRQCILDTVRRVVRITEYEKQERYYDPGDYWVNPKILAKALRFVAQEKARGKQMKFANAETIKWIGIDSFHMALHLDRAMEISEDVATNYIAELIAANELPPELDTPELAAKYLMDDLFSFVFKAPRFMEDEGLSGENEDLFWREEFESLIDLPTFESFSKKK
ncbi:MAG: hypothetical protein ABH884_00770 [Candidatus Komeilibacteria bacterium]